MQKGHYIAITGAAALVAILYFGVNTKPPAKKPDEAQPMAASGSPQGSNTVEAASFATILTDAKSRLSADASGKVQTLENELAAIRDSSQMAVGFYKLSNFWKDNSDQRLAAYYAAQSAKLENSEKKAQFCRPILSGPDS